MRFNDSNLMVGFIKELLHSFNLPMIPVYTETTTAFEGRSYIKDGYICKYEEGEFKKLAPY